MTLTKDDLADIINHLQAELEQRRHIAESDKDRESIRALIAAHQRAEAFLRTLNLWKE